MSDGARPRPAAVSQPPVSHHGIGAWAIRRLTGGLSNWRLLLVRTLTSGIAVVVTVLVLPGLSFHDWRRGDFLLIGVVFGLLTALVKPVLQFLALRYVVVSYGLVLVVVNALLLWLLSVLLGNLIHIRGLLPILAGGLVIGIIGTFLDTIAGVAPPVLDRRASPGSAHE